MRVESLDYCLPAEAIAQRPLAERDAARLLVVESSSIDHRRVRDLGSLLCRPALIVVNDTRVRRARLEATKASGGRVRLLLLGRLDAARGGERWLALASSNRPLQIGAELAAGDARLRVLERRAGGEIEVAIDAEDVDAFLEREGHVPLPPYIRRPDEPLDVERYQTVFARQLGSAAAPTAGLHLTPGLLDDLRARGHQIGSVTLHVGVGTFRPVRAPDLDDHPMHEEQFEVTPALSEQIAQARRDGRAVVAIGTTVVRALESARDPERPGRVLPRSAATRLLIQPGYDFCVVDSLLTNFHAPKSTLLALVAAFVGESRWREAYRAALQSGYRFLSYGDAMWLPRRIAASEAGSDSGSDA